MKKFIALMVVIAFVVGIVSIASAATTTVKKAAVKKVVKKVVKKAVVKKAAPQIVVPRVIAPPPPPVAVPPPPPAPKKVMAPAAPQSLFGWGVLADGSLGYVMNKSIIAGRVDAILPDPLGLGPMVGLSADSVKYRVGLGGFTGKDNSNLDFRGILVNLDGMIMIPASVLGGIESYLGGGINYKVVQSGSVGGQIYYGIAGDIGIGGKSFAQLGYTIIRTGTGVASGQRSSKGLGLEVGHSVLL